MDDDNDELAPFDSEEWNITLVPHGFQIDRYVYKPGGWENIKAESHCRDFSGTLTDPARAFNLLFEFLCNIRRKV